MPHFSSNRTKILFTVSVTAVLFGLLAFLGAVPLLSAVRKSQDRIQANRQELSSLTQKIDNLQEIGAKLRQIADTADAVVGIFPLREDSVILVEGLEKAIQAAGLATQLTIVDSQEGQPVGIAAPALVAKKLSGIEEVPYTLRFTGDYRQVVDLLMYLENTPFFTELTNLSLSADITANQRGTATVKLGTATGEIKGVLFIKKP